MNISASRIKTYEMCPQLYDWSYNKGLLTILSDALDVGIKYHSLVDNYYKTGDTKENFVGMEYDLLRCYLRNPVEGTIEESEKRYTFSIDGVEPQIVIIVDRKDTDKIIDYKTSSFDYTDDDCKNIQSKLYVYYYWKQTGIIFPFVHSVVNKKKIHQKKYKAQITKPLLYTEEELMNLPNELNEWLSKIDQKEYKPTPSPKCWGCGFGPYGINYCTHYQEFLYKKK